MNRILAIACCVAIAFGVGACSKEPAGDASSQAKPARPAEVAGPGAAQPAETTASIPQPGETAPEETAAAPVEAVTETEDREAAEGANTAQVQPSLRLGGPPSTPPTSSRFTAGTHYQTLVPAQPTNVAPGKVEVVEVFWYGCGHCFALDPAIESWRGKSKAPYVEFSRLPATWNESTRIHARVFYTAEVLGKLEELHSLIFREIHVNGSPFNTVSLISAFFKKHGVTSEDFEKAFTGFAVESKLQRAEFLNRRYRISSVPVAVVNGKYTAGVDSAGSEQRLFALIDELAAHEHGG